MGKNLSFIDRVVHIILGILLIIVPLSVMEESLNLYIVVLVGVMVLLMGLIGWSGIYSILGISTRKSAHNKISGNDIKKAVQGHVSESSKSSTTKKTTKKAPAKKAATKKTPAKVSASKTTTKKAPAKKAASKKTPAKASASKTTTKKAPAKKAAAKKTTTKKAKK